MSVYNDNLRWRYATKKFDPTKKLSKEQLEELVESLQLTASSFGLQTYKFLVLTDPALRAKMREHSWGQPQVTDASHLIAICTYRSIDASYVDHYIEAIAKTRGVTVESLKGFRDTMVGFLKARSPEEVAQWMRRQAYISIGFLLSAAAQQHIDACPMEGFEPQKIDADLGLAKENLTIVALCSVGFRAADDASASDKKVRFSQEELFEFRGN